MVRLITSLAMVLLSSVATWPATVAESDRVSDRVPGRPKVILVELFTSEGCSSCPPADALLRRINGTHPSADQLIVGISEHVTYSNSLGWSDPFSSSIYTDRQNAYGAKFGLDSVYTPQMVVNGTEQFVGSDETSLANALKQEQQRASPIDLHILSSSVDSSSRESSTVDSPNKDSPNKDPGSKRGNTLTVSFSASGDTSKIGADVVAVLVEDTAQSSVLRGENSGRTLSHVAVARLLLRVAKLQAADQQTVHIQLPPTIQTTRGHHIILFAQAHGTGRILGADSMPL